MNLESRVRDLENAGVFSEKTINVLKQAIEAGITDKSDLIKFIDKNFENEQKLVGAIGIGIIIIGGLWSSAAH